MVDKPLFCGLCCTPDGLLENRFGKQETNRSGKRPRPENRETMAKHLGGGGGSSRFLVLTASFGPPSP